ncbi:hypothetical protein ACIQUL_29990 [Streptomyces sp. NPDC090303]|uniref:hypothetical protein n=1 Tax=Streptomyces sp. NPDC090303 TaxID=3365960 RepID=UPI003802AD5B
MGGLVVVPEKNPKKKYSPSEIVSAQVIANLIPSTWTAILHEPVVSEKGGAGGGHTSDIAILQGGSVGNQYQGPQILVFDGKSKVERDLESEHGFWNKGADVYTPEKGGQSTQDEVSTKLNTQTSVVCVDLQKLKGDKKVARDTLKKALGKAYADGKVIIHENGANVEYAKNIFPKGK